MSAYGISKRNARANKWKAMNKVDHPVARELWKVAQGAMLLAIAAYLGTHLIWWWVR
jgi:type VI protein secretion system component VasF